MLNNVINLTRVKPKKKKNSFFFLLSSERWKLNGCYSIMDHGMYVHIGNSRGISYSMARSYVADRINLSYTEITTIVKGAGCKSMERVD